MNPSLNIHRHIVPGWSISRKAKTGEMVYDINFKRLPSQLSVDAVLRRPFADEVEDYREFKRLREAARIKQAVASRARMPAGTPATPLSSDGVQDSSMMKRSDSVTE